MGDHLTPTIFFSVWHKYQANYAHFPSQPEFRKTRIGRQRAPFLQVSNCLILALSKMSLNCTCLYLSRVYVWSIRCTYVQAGVAMCVCGRLSARMCACRCGTVCVWSIRYMYVQGKVHQSTQVTCEKCATTHDM